MLAEASTVSSDVAGLKPASAPSATSTAAYAAVIRVRSEVHAPAAADPRRAALDVRDCVHGSIRVAWNVRQGGILHDRGGITGSVSDGIHLASTAEQGQEQD